LNIPGASILKTQDLKIPEINDKNNRRLHYSINNVSRTNQVGHRNRKAKGFEEEK
jgi:hypothetical protein